MSGMLEDNNGNKSSKRVAGICIVTGSGIMAATLFTFSLFKTVADASTAITVLKTTFITGASLLGIGVVEMFGVKK